MTSPNVTSIGVTNGVPTTGSGFVSTIDALMADGGQATLGSQADAAYVSGNGTAIAILKGLFAKFAQNVGPYQYAAKSPGQHNLALVTAQTLTIPSGATCAWVQPKNGTVSFTMDGATTPTSTVGMTMTAPMWPPLFLSGTQLTNFKAFSSSGATLDVEYGA